jgi:hypothetical protein
MGWGARDAGVRPVRASSTICRLNSGVYRTDLSAIVNASKTNLGVSTKPGQVQFGYLTANDGRPSGHKMVYRSSLKRAVRRARVGQ